MPKGGKRKGAGPPLRSPYSPLNDSPVQVRLGTLRDDFDRLRGGRSESDVVREAVDMWIRANLDVDTAAPTPL